MQQVDVDALWLAARVEVCIAGEPWDLRKMAQLRLTRLMASGVIEYRDGRPVLTENPDAE